MLRRLALLLVLALSAVAPSAGAQDLGSLVRQLAEGGFGEREQTINAIAALGDPAGAHALAALGEGDLYQRKSDKSVFIAVREGRRYKLTDPLTGEAAGEAARREVDKIRVNNQLRRVIRNALGALTLRNPNRAKRLEAAESLFKSRDPDAVEALDVAIAAETDSSVLAAMRQARAAGVLAGDAPEEAKIEALGVVAERGDRDALALLSNTRNAAQGALKDAAEAAIDRVESSLALWGALQNVWYGLSLGSVLLLAAIGLAITFGVMGVINMAHGEMVMLGAYTTFVVQETIRNSAPWLFDWSLAIAIPLAFLVAGGVGILIERGIIRFLYQRPLETLLATWGLSLILQQTVRSMFGPTNQEVGNPSWMAGAFELGNLTITYNRMWIIFFALLVIGALVLLFKMTSFGLQMRAVTQNRDMARAMGIRTPLIDALTFGLGSGIAGIAGVALSQIDNVSPNLGQGYIVDSFMVVVFGGVGNVWGTLVGAMTLGITNKFLEPYAGAVLGKILVLVFIILFIQKRPRGLFAPKGRAVEA